MLEFEQLIDQLKVDGEVFIPASRKKIFTMLLLCIGCGFLCFVIYFGANHTLGLIFMIICLIAIPFLILLLIFPRFFCIHISSKGVGKRGLLSKYYDWQYISSVSITNCGFQKAVSFNYKGGPGKLVKGIIKVGSAVAPSGMNAEFTETLTDMFDISISDLHRLITEGQKLYGFNNDIQTHTPRC